MKTTARNFATCLLTLVISLFINCELINAQSKSESVATMPSSFSTSNDILGAAANSVNLFTGEVALPVQLVSIPGRGGLNAGAAIAYSTAGVRGSRYKSNIESPTGILGLGWTLERPQIIVDNKQTGSREDDEFYLFQGGVSNKLIRTKGTSTAKEYILENYLLP